MLNRPTRLVARAVALTAALTSTACGGDDDDSGDGDSYSGLVEISGDGVSDDGYLDRVVLSVWGDSADSVYFVGGGLGVVSGGDPVPGLFMHWDGETFTELGTVDETLWWTHGFADDDVWAVGAAGTIAHWNGSEVVVTTAPVEVTLSGVWGTSSDDLFAVGGLNNGSAAENDIILRCAGNCESGDSWQQMEPGATSGKAYFKVWGTANDDVYLVGEEGMIQHWDGVAWTAQDSGTEDTLITVYGAGDDVWVVGGFADGMLLHSDDEGETWTPDDSQAFGSGLTGLYVSSGTLFVVGLNGQRFRLVDGTWEDYSQEMPHVDLHSVWLDSSGDNGFAVGGNFSAPASSVAQRSGAIVRLGSSVPAATLEGP